MRFLIQRIHGLTINWSPDSHQNLFKTQICTDQASDYKHFVQSHVKVKMQMGANFLCFEQTELSLATKPALTSFPPFQSVILPTTQMHQSEMYTSPLIPLSFTLHIYTITKAKISLKSVSLFSLYNTVTNPRSPDLLAQCNDLLMSLYFYLYISFSSNPEPKPFSMKQLEPLRKQMYQ